MKCVLRWIAATLFALIAPHSAGAGLSGAIIMHGKGEMPDRWVTEMANALRRENVIVAAPELPWSARRLYDRSVDETDAEIDALIASLRDQEARRVYLIGHSVSAAYALRYAARPTVTGIVAIAPVHAPEGPVYIRSFANDVRRARELIAAGRPQAVLDFLDLHWGDRRNRITTTARAFLSYYDAAGPMNMMRNAQALRNDVPVLWIVPLDADRATRQAALDVYQRLPHHVGTRLAEVPADYTRSPEASVPLIVEWMRDMVALVQTE